MDLVEILLTFTCWLSCDGPASHPEGARRERERERRRGRGWWGMTHTRFIRYTTENVAKCNLGKVNLEPMQSAVAPICVRDLRGGPLQPACSSPRGLQTFRVTIQLIFADHLRF